jgi:two-component system NtrC family sensor kinase
MKLVAKYTLVLVTALAIALSVLTFYRTRRERDNFQGDMTADHRVVGHVLQVNAIDLWNERGGVVRPPSEHAIDHLIDRANMTAGPTRFEWVPGQAPADETHRVEGREFVSRFPVRVAGHPIGTIVVHESLDDTDRLVRHGVLFSVVSVVVVVLLSFAASLVLGRWLVGKPIGKLVDKARRIGQRDFSSAVELRRRDELGELATAMNAMSAELADALHQISLETEARVRAVEQMRHADRLSTVGKLAAGVAHELGTPLSIVGGHAQMIAGREVTGDAVIDSASAIDREATRMSRIVRQLLDFARRRGPEGTTSDVAAVAGRCLDLLSPMAKKAEVTAKLEVAEPLRALIDDDSLQQVLTNLVVNAVQAMPAGGELRVTTARERTAAPDTPGNTATPWIRITVTDTGKGIPADAVAHIFEPFFTTKQPGDGTGLGLAVVYGIVVDHHGWITVDSSERGTAFSVFLQEAVP